MRQSTCPSHEWLTLGHLSATANCKASNPKELILSFLDVYACCVSLFQNIIVSGSDLTISVRFVKDLSKFQHLHDQSKIRYHGQITEHILIT